MFENVIVGVDGDEGGRDAIALAGTLRDQAGAVTLAYVYTSDPLMYRGVSAAYEVAQRKRARELVARVHEESGIKAEHRIKGSPSVGRGLHELAEEIGADLLVIGSSRRGVIGRVLLGDDTRAALAGAPCAVAIAPAGYAQRPTLMRQIGVGYNGSRESEHALVVARKLAARHDSRLSAFEAVSLPSYALGDAIVPLGDMIDELVEGARERVAELDGVDAHAAYGVPAEELALYSASLDLLVIGSRDYGPMGRLVHGSTARQLARIARCPLLVLTRAVRSAEPSPGAGDVHTP